MTGECPLNVCIQAEDERIDLCNFYIQVAVDLMALQEVSAYITQQPPLASDISHYAILDLSEEGGAAADHVAGAADAVNRTATSRCSRSWPPQEPRLTIKFHTSDKVAKLMLISCCR